MFKQTLLLLTSSEDQKKLGYIENLKREKNKYRCMINEQQKVPYP